ncbi:MAG: MFS transporter, partial [Burkholderiaceae bacterium]
SMGDRTLTIYCGLLLALSAFSIDITLPFFDRIRDTLQASDEATHAIVTLYIFSIGIGQLIMGPISDRFGRRKAIAAGLSLYLTGAFITIFATNIETLLAGRALQGLGGAAAPVTARAMIRDRFSGTDLARNMALASGIFAIGPIIAPLIGAALVAGGGNWRVIFVAMFILGMAMLIGLAFVPETLRERRPNATSLGEILRNTGTLFRNPQSRYFLLLCSWTMVAILTILAGMPGVMEKEFGITGTAFAILFSIHGLGIIAGQIANHWLIGKIGVLQTAIAAAFLITAVFAITTYAAHHDGLTAIRLALLLVGFAVGYLIVFANSASLIMDPHPTIAGFTAAFFGSFTQIVASIITMGIMFTVGASVEQWSLALLFVCATILIALIAWYINNRRSEI